MSTPDFAGGPDETTFELSVLPLASGTWVLVRVQASTVLHAVPLIERALGPVRIR